ncbi:MAG: hypothetical protein VB980_03305, partial [Opitutales bacterium]
LILGGFYPFFILLIHLRRAEKKQLAVLRCNSLLPHPSHPIEMLFARETIMANSRPEGICLLSFFQGMADELKWKVSWQITDTLAAVLFYD